jgi:hypothetical protein
VERIQIKVREKGLFLLLTHRFNPRSQIVEVLTGALYSLEGASERMRGVGSLGHWRCSFFQVSTHE